MFGLDRAGKTAILYHLKLHMPITTIPTLGFNIESIPLKNVNVEIWDIGGQSELRLLWPNYYEKMQILIFVLDSCDMDRFEEAYCELHRLLEDNSDAVLLVYANKQASRVGGSRVGMKIQRAPVAAGIVARAPAAPPPC